MRVLVATDIAARGLDIDQLPQVVNFELPNVPEDYVHRIGRTGRAGSSGAAVSLVDREELKLLKDIEKLIKREIPKVHVEGFTPNANPEPEAPRSTQPHGRPPRGHGQGQQRKAHVTSNNEGNSANANAGRTQNRSNGQRNGPGNGQGNEKSQGRNQTGFNTEGRPNQGNQQKPAQNSNTKLMSEAARHQAMPQPALFVPPSPSRHQPNRQNTTRPNDGRGNTGRTNANPNSTHRSGGRGR